MFIDNYFKEEGVFFKHLMFISSLYLTSISKVMSVPQLKNHLKFKTGNVFKEDFQVMVLQLSKMKGTEI